MTDNNLDQAGSFDLPKDPVSTTPPNDAFNNALEQANNKFTAGEFDSGVTKPVFENFSDLPFSTYETNYYRYARRNNFDELGFSPYRDNETLYNNESNFFGEVSRGLQGAAVVAFNTGLDGWQETADVLGGKYSSVSDWWNSYDVGAAEDFADVNRKYGSTKENATSFIANGLLNTGFIGGMVIGSLPEIAAEAVLTAEAGGIGGLLGIGRATSKGAKGLKYADEARDALKAAKVNQSTVLNSNKTNKLASSLNNALKSSTGNAYFKLTDNAIAKALNPFSNTGAWLNDGLRDIKQGKKLDDVLDLGKGAGAMLQDLTIIKGAKIEASLEAGDTANRIRDEYINDFFEKNGRLPEGEELSEIDAVAGLAAGESIMGNMPLILYTDKLLFNPLFRGLKRSAKSLNLGRNRNPKLNNGLNLTDEGFDVDYNRVGPKAEGKTTKQFIADRGKFYLKGLVRPSTWKSLTQTTLTSGVGEGFQEVGQEITADLVETKYKDILENPMHLPLMSTQSYLVDSFKNVFGEDGQGYHAFASGMFVGGLFGAGGGKLAKAAGLVKKENRQDYLKYHQERQAQLEELADILNENYKDPYTMFRPSIRTFAEINEANKKLKDIQTLESLFGGELPPEMAAMKKELLNEMLFTRVSAALETDTYDVFVDRLKEMQQLEDSALLEVTGEEDITEARKKLDEAIEYSGKIKENHKQLQDKYPNPFNYDNISITDSKFNETRANYESFEQAKRHLLFLTGDVQDLQLKRQELQNKLTNARLSRTWSALDKDSVTSLSAADNEIALLEKEVLASAGAKTAEEKLILNTKKKKLAALTTYRNNFEEYLETIDGLKEDQSDEAGKKREKAANKLKRSLLNYIKKADAANVALGGVSTSALEEVTGVEQDKVVSQFLSDLIDFNIATKDSQAAVDLLNILDNPASLNELAGRYKAIKEDIFVNKRWHIKRSIENFLDSVEKNEILHDLKKIGVAIDINELTPFLNSGVVPTRLYSLRNGQELNMNNAKAKEALEIINNYAKVKELRKQEQDAEKQRLAAEKAAKMSAAPTIPTPGTDSSRPQTGNPKVSEAEKIIKDQLNPGENYTDAYARLAKETPGMDSLLINYLNNADLSYTTATELLSDPKQGPQFLALALSIAKAYKQANIQSPISEWVSTSAASQSNIINDAIGRIYPDGSVNVDDFLKLLSSVESVGNIEKNLAEGERVVQQIEGTDLYIVSILEEVADTDGFLNLVESYVVRNSKGILSKEVHGNARVFGTVESAMKAYDKVSTGIVGLRQAKAPGRAIYKLDGAPGVTATVNTIWERGNNKYRITAFGSVNTDGSGQKTAGVVQVIILDADGNAKPGATPLEVTSDVFAAKYTFSGVRLDLPAYTNAPKLRISNVSGIEYLKDDATQKEILELYEELGAEEFLNRISFSVEENTKGKAQEGAWSVGGFKNELLNRKAERATIRVILTKPDNTPVQIGFLNDPQSYVFKDIQGRKGSFNSSNLNLQEGVHYSLDTSKGLISKSDLDAAYKRQDLLYTALANKKGLTVTLESLRSEGLVDVQLGNPSYIFEKTEGAADVTFDQLKYKTYKGRVVVYDTAEKRIVGLNRLESESQGEFSKFRMQALSRVEADQSRWAGYTSRFVLLSDYADKVIYTELIPRAKTETEIGDLVSQLKENSDKILADQAEKGSEYKLDKDERKSYFDFFRENLFLRTVITPISRSKGKTAETPFRVGVTFGYTNDGKFKIDFDSLSPKFKQTLIFSYAQMGSMFESTDAFLSTVNQAIKDDYKRLGERAYIKKKASAEIYNERRDAIEGARAAYNRPLPEITEEMFLNTVSTNLTADEDFANLKSNVTSPDMIRAPKIALTKVAVEGLEDNPALALSNAPDTNNGAIKKDDPVANTVVDPQAASVVDQAAADNTRLSQVEAEMEVLEEEYGTEVYGVDEYMQLRKEQKEINKRLGLANKILNTYTPENKAQLDDFLGWVRGVLPDFVSVEVTDKIAERMHNEGLTVGQFIMRAKDSTRSISELEGIVSILPDSPSKYHEAFHAVFRMLLTDKEIRNALKQGERELRAELRKNGRTITDEMNRYRTLSSFYADMSQLELKERIVEEYLADKFEEFKKQPKGTKTAAANKSIFRKIIDFLINLFTDYPANMLMDNQELFEAIDAGKYKTANVQSNVFTRSAASTRESIAYSILPIGSKEFVSETVNGEAVNSRVEQYLNAEDNIRVLNGITAYVYDKLKSISDVDQNVNSNVDVLIQEAVTKYRSLYNTKRTEYYNTPEKVERASNLRKALIRAGEPVMTAEGEFTGLVLYPQIKTYVEDSIKMFDAVDDISDNEVVDGGVVQFFENTETQNALKGLPTIVRALIGTTTVIASDNFGNEFFVDKDGNPSDERIAIPAPMQTVYNGLIRVVADSNGERELFQRLLDYKSMSNGKSSHEEINMFIDVLMDKFNLLQDVVDEEGNVVGRELSFDNVKNTQLYQAFIKAFDKSKRDYLFYSVDIANKEVRVFTANRKGETAAQYDNWKEAWEYKYPEIRDNAEKRNRLRTVLTDLSDFVSINITPEQFEADKESLTDLLKELANLSGIELSEDYIEYSYYANMLEAGKIDGAAVKKEFYNMYSRLKIPFLKAEMTGAQKQASDFSIIASLIQKDSGRGLFMRDYAFEEEAENSDNVSKSAKTITQTAGGRLKTIAGGNVYFNANIDVSTFSNAEGNNIQSYQLKTVLVRKINELNAQGKLEELLEDPYLADHWLLESEAFRNLLENNGLKSISIDGIAARNHKAGAGLSVNQSAGHTYGDFTDREFYLSLLSNYVKRASYEGGELTVPVYMRVLEASRTGMMANLPVVRAVNFEGNPVSAIDKSGFSFTEEFSNIVFSDLARDLDRINRVHQDKDSGFVNELKPGVDRVKGYNILSENAIQDEMAARNKTLAENPEAGVDSSREAVIKDLEPTLKGYRINDDFRMLLVDGYIAQGQSEEAAEKLVADIETGARTSNEIDLKDKEAITEALLLGLYRHFQKFQEALDEEGLLFKTKDGYTFDTQKKRGRSANPLIGVLGAEALSYLPQEMAEMLNLQQDYVQGSDMDRSNVKLDKRKLETNLAQIFFNGFINARAINQVTNGDHAALFKNPIDVVKRAKGLNASGITAQHSITDADKGINHSLENVGDLQHLLFEDELFEGQFSGEQQQRDDGQLYMTTKGLRHVLFGMGRLSNYHASLIDRIENGEDIPLTDVLGTGGRRGSVQYNAQTNSLKLVYYDGKTYLKMSAFVLTPNFTKREAAKAALNNNKPSFLNNLRLILEARELATNSVVLASPESASKTYKPNVVSRDVIEDAQGNVLDDFFDNEFAKLDPKFLMLSTETPSNKMEITDPTQMMNIILAEYDPSQDDNVVFIKGQKTTIGELKREYLDNGAAIITDKYFGAREELFDLEDIVKELKTSRDLNKVTVKLDEFRKYAVKTLKDIGASPQEIELFEDPEINLNNSITYNRFQNLILSRFSTGVFKQKTNGYKLTLVSDAGISVIRKRNTKGTNGLSVDTVIPYKEFEKLSQSEKDSGEYYSSPLEYNVEVKNAQGEVIERYSEMMMPQHSENQQLQEALFAVRIPSQDKHSAMNTRVVDFMDAHYGSVAVLPKELIEISGADFDIDSLFIHAPETFRNQAGEVKEYGDPSLSPKDVLYSYFTFMYRTNEDFRDLYVNSENVAIEDPNKLRIINMKVATEVAKTLGLPHNIELYKQAVKENNNVDLITYSRSNRRLEIKRALLGSDFLNEKIGDNNYGRAQEPANLKPFKEFESWAKSQDGLAAWLKELDRKGRITDSMLGQVEAFTDISEGAEGIGPAVNAAVAFSIINAFGLTVKGKSLMYGGIDVSDFTESLNSDGKRKMNLLSAVITGMTDNAKEQLAKKFGLNTEVVGQLGYLLAGGMPFNDAILLFNQPVVKEYYKQVKNSKSAIKLANDESAGRALNALRGRIIEILTDRNYTMPEETGSLNQEVLVSGLEYGSNGFYSISEDMSSEQLVDQLNVLDFLEKVANASQKFSDFAKLTKLSRGLGKTVADFDNYVELATQFKSDDFEGSIGVPNFQPLFDKEDGHSVMAAQAEIIEELDSLFPKVFITRSPVINDIKTLMSGVTGVPGFKARDFNKDLTRDLISILMGKAYMRELGNKGLTKSKNLSNALIYDSLKEKSGSTDIITIVQELRKHLDGKGKSSKFLNDFIRSSGMTNLDGTINSRNKDGINKISINSFTKLSPQSMHIFNSEFVDLYTDTDVIEGGPLAGTTVRGAITDMMHYLLVKDGMSFRSGSFLSYIPALAVKDVIKVMEGVVESVKDYASTNALMVKTLGQQYGVVLQELVDNWPRHSSSYNYIQDLFSPNFSNSTELAEKRDQMLTVDKENGTITFDFFARPEGTPRLEGEAYLADLKNAQKVTKALGLKTIDVSDTSKEARKNPDSRTAFPLYIKYGKKLYKIKTIEGGKMKGSDKYYYGYKELDLSHPVNKGTEAAILNDSRKFIVPLPGTKSVTPTFFGSKVVWEEVKAVGETAQFGGGYIFGELPARKVRQSKKKDVTDPNLSAEESVQEPSIEIDALSDADLKAQFGGPIDLADLSAQPTQESSNTSVSDDLAMFGGFSDDIFGSPADSKEVSKKASNAESTKVSNDIADALNGEVESDSSKRKGVQESYNPKNDLKELVNFAKGRQQVSGTPYSETVISDALVKQVELEIQSGKSRESAIQSAKDAIKENIKNCSLPKK